MQHLLIDLRPLIDQVVFPFLTALLVPLGGGIASWALYKVGAAAHVQVTQATAARLERGFQNATTLVLGRAQAAADTAGAKVTVDQPMIADGVAYLKDTMLPELKSLKIDPATLGARLEARIMARVPSVAPAQITPAAPAQPPA